MLVKYMANLLDSQALLPLYRISRNDCVSKRLREVRFYLNCVFQRLLMYITLASAGLRIKNLHEKKFAHASQNSQSQSFEIRNLFMIYGSSSTVLPGYNTGVLTIVGEQEQANSLSYYTYNVHL